MSSTPTGVVSSGHSRAREGVGKTQEHGATLSPQDGDGIPRHGNNNYFNIILLLIYFLLRI